MPERKGTGRVVSGPPKRPAQLPPRKERIEVKNSPSSGGDASRGNGGAEEHHRRCPVCEQDALRITRKPSRYRGLVTLIYCLACKAGLDAIHERSGIPKPRLLTLPPHEDLGPPVAGSSSGRATAPEPLPSESQFAGWQSRLLSDSMPSRTSCASAG